ncbi:citrate lyase holo-[acyl-carrier protein] synthase [Clostridium brassicae]|uniref:citrate lyase holo-[acyl-carrier protein] synthase n=1 Tax=Clostridium brassicae TaxID=2999072 RepID=A0ABT4D548_9CLOT|nr:citrate lyase holo-[acyl-carrier protein] synthase [Clostridium brassicae]MCY6957402.1 citrate lyase holo-[acyl-carrier protein] synthase [Clostridium brassicae]
MKYSKEDILLDKKNRFKFQESLIKKFNMPLVVVTVNYPGISRYNDITNNIIENIDNIISDIFSFYIHFKVLRITGEGPILTIALDKDPKEIKHTAIQIEDKHILGKCVDIEIYDKDVRRIERNDLGCFEKRCFLCNNYWEECKKLNSHGDDEIMQYVVEKYREYMDSFSGRSI